MLKLLLACFIFSINSQVDSETDCPLYVRTIFINDVNVEELLELPFIEEEDAYLIIKEREKKEFENKEDFIRRVPLEHYKLQSLIPFLEFKQRRRIKGNYTIYYKDGDITGYGRFKYGNIFMKAKFYRGISFIAGNTRIQAGIFETRYSWKSKSLNRYLTGNNLSFYFNFPLLEGGLSKESQIIKFKTPFFENRLQIITRTEKGKLPLYILQFMGKRGKIHLVTAAEYDSTFNEKFKIWTYTEDVLLSFTLLHEQDYKEYRIKFSKMLSKNLYFIYRQEIGQSRKTALGLKTKVGSNLNVLLSITLKDNTTLFKSPIKVEMRNNMLVFTYYQDVEYSSNFSSLCLNFDKLSVLYSISRNYSSLISLGYTGIGYHSEFISSDETLAGVFYNTKIYKTRLAAGLVSENFKTFKIQLTLKGEL